jgi:hypothetical protein
VQHDRDQALETLTSSGDHRSVFVADLRRLHRGARADQDRSRRGQKCLLDTVDDNFSWGDVQFVEEDINVEGLEPGRAPAHPKPVLRRGRDKDVIGSQSLDLSLCWCSLGQFSSPSGLPSTCAGRPARSTCAAILLSRSLEAVTLYGSAPD